MKKKIAVLALAFASLSSFAFEANVKTGFDFYRDHEKLLEVPGTQDEKGFTLGAELIPYNKGVVEVGTGFEYNFGTTNAVYSNKMFIPVYVLSHVNLARSEDNSGSLYALGRFGGVAYKKADDAFKGGVYYGAGLGADFHGLVAEILYDGAYIPEEAEAEQFQNKVGVRFGFKVGDYKTKAPVVKKEVVKAPEMKPMVKVPEVVVVKPEVKPEVKPIIIEKEVIKEVPVIKEVIKEVIVEKPVIKEVIKEVIVEKPVMVKPEVKKPMVKPVVATEDNIPEFIHANCAEETKICTIYGFKVDGRTPNEKEKNALNEVVDVVNNYASAGNLNVVGHTDSTGSAKYNQKLSLERAKTVAKLLKEYGLKESITIDKVFGEGEAKPADTNKTKLGRYHNRRVELRFNDLQK